MTQGDPQTAQDAIAALQHARYRVRLGRGPADTEAVLRLRGRAFHGNPDHPDQDPFDATCDHLMIETRDTRALVCCCRVLPLTSDQILRSYSAQFYGLEPLSAFPGLMLEMGRLCTDPSVRDPDVLRLAWGAMTAYVDARGVRLLFGCASFRGTDAAAYHDAFAMLHARHLAPPHWLPRVKAPDVVQFARVPGGTPRDALRRMPPLLKTYLMMGGWVSDHAVIDHAMNTLHVFTGVEIAAIPPTRKRLLRAVAHR